MDGNGDVEALKRRPPSTTPPSDRVALRSPAEFIEVCTQQHIRLFRASPYTIYAIGPGSSREPSRESWEVTPQEGARFLFRDYLWNGKPILEPYVSASRPDRLGFRYTEAGRAYREERMAARKQERRK